MTCVMIGSWDRVSPWALLSASVHLMVAPLADQADTGTPLATPLNTAPQSWGGARAVPPQQRSLADRMRHPFGGGRTGPAGASSSAGPYNV